MSDRSRTFNAGPPPAQADHARAGGAAASLGWLLLVLVVLALLALLAVPSIGLAAA